MKKNIVETTNEARIKLAEEMALKIKLESAMSLQLRRLFREIGYAFAGQYTKNGEIIDLNQFKDDFVGVLRENYRKVATKFGYGLIKEIDKKKANDKEYENLIDAEISASIIALSLKEADLILDTTKTNLVNDVNQVLTQAALDGETLSYADVAEDARKKFVENSITRSDTIAETEVQSVAELSKQIEADTLSDAGATIDGNPLGDSLDKTWVATLDSKTRLSHAMADGQTVDMHDSFNVGGEDLQFPGDPNASPENRINCRCSMIQSLK